MAQRRKTQSVDWLITQIDQQLARFGKARSGYTLREKVLALAEVYEHMKDLSVSAVAESGLDSKGARDRIRLYFIQYVEVRIQGAEIAVVSGIADYPRRIRELRVEQGYQIASGASPDPESGIELKPDEYLLVSTTPDTDAARRWHVANRIRRSAAGSQEKVLAFLMENVGQVVTTEELAYVAKDAKEYARRTRELRTEEGFAVATRFTGRPDLKVGQYVLQSAERIAQPHDRHISNEVQQEVYKRDGNRCRICGWDLTRWKKDDPRILELHHFEHHQHGGANSLRNLIVACSKCHDEIHAGKHVSILKEIAKSF
jgi:hypothetical protein